MFVDFLAVTTNNNLLNQNNICCGKKPLTWLFQAAFRTDKAVAFVGLSMAFSLGPFLREFRSKTCKLGANSPSFLTVSFSLFGSRHRWIHPDLKAVLCKNIYWSSKNHCNSNNLLKSAFNTLSIPNLKLSTTTLHPKKLICKFIQNMPNCYGHRRGAKWTDLTSLRRRCLPCTVW